MCLRLVFLLITRVAAWLRLFRREEAWKTAEILILRHQLAVLQRRQPRRPHLNWADRALLAALLSVIPKARRQGLRLLVTPDTILRWHRDVVRRRWSARSKRGRTGRPATRQEALGESVVTALAGPAEGQHHLVVLREAGEVSGRVLPGQPLSEWKITPESGSRVATALPSIGDQLSAQVIGHPHHAAGGDVDHGGQEQPSFPVRM